MSREPYPSDVSDDERAFLAPCPTLMREDASRRERSLREVLNALRHVARSGRAWRMLPHDPPPWHAVHRQAQRWFARGCFEAAASDLRTLLRLREGKEPSPTAAVLDGRVVRSTPESGHRAGDNGRKRTKGSKVPLAVDTLGRLLALTVTPARVDERKAVAELARLVQEETGGSVELAYVDQGYTGPKPAAAAAEEGIRLEAVSLPEAKRAFVLLPRRWVVERSFAWSARFKRLAKDYERLPETLAGLHVLVFCALMLGALAPWLQGA